MKLKFCSCRYCKFGRKSKWNQKHIKQLQGGHRRKVKVALAKGKEFVPNEIAVGITS